MGAMKTMFSFASFTRQIGVVWQGSRWLAVLAGLVLATGCGGGGGGGGSDAAPPPPPVAPLDPGVAGAPYFPLAVGDRWRSRSGSDVETTRVVAQEAGGFRLRTEGAPGVVDEQRLTVSASGVRYEPVPGTDALVEAIGGYDVARFPLRVGAAYTALDRSINARFDFDGDGRLDNLRVLIEVTVSGFESLTVPAGSFSNVLRQRTTVTQTFGLSGTSTPVVVTARSDDWYAPGVGPVRSLLVIEGTGAPDTTEELLLAYRVGALSNDTVAPTVATRTPADASVGRFAIVQLTFSEDIERPVSPAVFEVRDANGVVVAGSSRWIDNRTVQFAPAQFDGLANGSFTARLNGSVEDWAGNRYVDTQGWRFAVDARGPTVVAQSPAPDATEVPIRAVLSLTFDEPLDPALAVGTNVQLSGPLGGVAITVVVEGNVLRITPNAALRAGETYSLAIPGGIQDPLGNATNLVPTRFTTTRGEPGRFNFPIELQGFSGQSVFSPNLVDIDGDGRADLVALAIGVGPRILRRLSDGSFSAVAETVPDPNCRASSFEVVDLDADGRLDILGAPSFCGTSWLQQLAGGAWREGGSLGPPGHIARPIRLAGQARPGILISGNFDPDLYLVRPGGGAGTVDFEPREIVRAGIGGPNLLHVADINGDGLDDFVLGGGGRVWLGRQRADASFELEPITVPGVRAVLLVSDLNGDGRKDLLLKTGAVLDTTLLLLSQAPDGTFLQPARQLVLPAPADEAFRVDINGDGIQELIVTALENGTVSNLAIVTLRSDGSLAYEPLLQYTTLPSWSGSGFGRSAFIFSDFNGDGLIDLLHRGLLVTGRTPVVVPAAAHAGHLGAAPALQRRGLGLR